MIDFVGKKRWFFLLSAAIIICGIIFFAAAGIPWGIDFAGGTIMTVKYQEDKPVSHDTLETKLIDLGHDEATIQEDKDEHTFLVRIEELNDEEQTEMRASLADLELSVESFDLISDPVAKEKARGAAIAVVVAAIGILIYISWAFRRLPKPFRYGTCAIIALVHDVLIAVSVFAILGSALNLEINLMFVTGLLTVIGYSVNDTIVVFDRIRENLGKDTRQPFETVVNNSLVETLGRSLMTSLTTLLVLVSVYLFVGEAIRSFLLVLIVGVISGTYSSIFIASQALVVWETGAVKKLFNRMA
ncbi:MAG: protein translocase subunit SecF [Chloroflexota bacterium]|nr:protein translocase subunit SecF [Chloroflexota bacterium]